MQRIFRVALAVSLATPVFAATPVDQRAAVAADARIDISSPRGTLRITGWDQPELAISGTLGTHAKRVDVTGDEHHRSVTVEFGTGFFTTREDTVLDIHVPHTAVLAIDIASADVAVTAVDGSPLTVKGSSGDVKLDTNAARVVVESASGDVDVRGRAADTTIHTASGDIKIHGIGGKLQLRSRSGDIEGVLADYTDVDARTTSGDVDLGGTPAAGSRMAIATTSGDVDLALPAGMPARITATTSSGEIRSDFGIVAPSAGGDRRSLAATVGTGTDPVDIRTTSGDIEIRRR